MSDTQVDAYRALYRFEEIGPNYSGLAHLAATSIICLTAMVYAASRLQAVSIWEWLTIPLTFLFANFAEHAGHSGPMHHRRRGLGAVYHRHARQHHRFFTRERMEVASRYDYKAVLVPPVLAVFFIIFFVLPVGVPVALLTTKNVAYLFAITGIGYFLNFEWLHFAYHMDEQSWIGRLPGLSYLRQHHALHHDQTLMSRYNFNISYPIADRILGTYYRPNSSLSQPRTACDEDNAGVTAP